SWADAHHARTGSWPTSESGPITDAAGETWRRVDSDLRIGLRGLPGGSSLARLLAGQRGVRNPAPPPPLEPKHGLAWADAHHQRSGGWPTSESGAIPEAPGETWRRVDTALRLGARGLQGSSSLAQLLARQRGVRNVHGLRPLSVDRILSWADSHHRRTGA